MSMTERFTFYYILRYCVLMIILFILVWPTYFFFVLLISEQAWKMMIRFFSVQTYVMNLGFSNLKMLSTFRYFKTFFSWYTEINTVYIRTPESSGLGPKSFSRAFKSLLLVLQRNNSHLYLCIALMDLIYKEIQFHLTFIKPDVPPGCIHKAQVCFLQFLQNNNYWVL